MTDVTFNPHTVVRPMVAAMIMLGLVACDAPDTRNAATNVPNQTAATDGTVPIVQETVQEPVLSSIYRIESGDLRAVRAESGFDVTFEGGRSILTPVDTQVEGKALPIFVPINRELSSQLEGQPIRVVVEARGTVGSTLNVRYSTSGAGNSGDTMFELSNSFEEYTLDYDVSDRADTGNDRVRMGYTSPEGGKPLEIKSISIYTRS